MDSCRQTQSLAVASEQLLNSSSRHSPPPKRRPARLEGPWESNDNSSLAYNGPLASPTTPGSPPPSQTADPPILERDITSIPSSVVSPITPITTSSPSPEPLPTVFDFHREATYTLPSQGNFLASSNPHLFHTRPKSMSHSNNHNTTKPTLNNPPITSNLRKSFKSSRTNPTNGKSSSTGTRQQKVMVSIAVQTEPEAEEC